MHAGRIAKAPSKSVEWSPNDHTSSKSARQSRTDASA